MEKRWCEIAFIVPSQWVEVLPVFLEEKGLVSYWIDSEKKPPFRSIVRAYLSEQSWTAKLEKELEVALKKISSFLPEGLQSTEIQKRFIDDEDWASRWLPFFDPLQVGPVWIRPRKKFVQLSEGEKEIIIDPGQAFGTGHHETTRLCLESILRLRPLIKEHTKVLDFGTGSGILAMYAATLGLTNILALDTDPVAVATARKNVFENKLASFVEISDCELETLTNRFGLVLANLSTAVLSRLCDDLKRRVEAGGWIIVSGILAEEVRDLNQLFRSTGMELVDKKFKQEWACLIFRKPTLLNFQKN